MWAPESVAGLSPRPRARSKLAKYDSHNLSPTDRALPINKHAGLPVLDESSRHLRRMKLGTLAAGRPRFGGRRGTCQQKQGPHPCQRAADTHAECDRLIDKSHEVATTLAIGRTTAVANGLLRVLTDATCDGVFSEICAVARGILAANATRAIVEIALNSVRSSLLSFLASLLSSALPSSVPSSCMTWACVLTSQAQHLSMSLSYPSAPLSQL